MGVVTSAAVAVIALGVMVAVAGVLLGIAAARGYTLAGSAGPGGTDVRRVVRTSPRLTRLHLIAGGLGLLVFVVSGWLLAGVATVLCALLIPDLWVDKRATRVIDKLEGLSAWTRRLADLMASGAATSLESALVKSVSMCPPVIEPQVRRLADRLRPRGTEAALRAFADEIDDPAGDHVAAALILRARTGGRGLAGLLADLATDIEAQVSNRRQIEADRAKPMSNVRMIIVLTVLMSVAMILFGGDYMAPFRQPFGQVLLALPMGMLVGALVWIRDLTKAQVGARFLVDDTTPTGTPRPVTPGGAAAHTGAAGTLGTMGTVVGGGLR